MDGWTDWLFVSSLLFSLKVLIDWLIVRSIDVAFESSRETCLPTWLVRFSSCERGSKPVSYQASRWAVCCVVVGGAPQAFILFYAYAIEDTFAQLKFMLAQISFWIRLARKDMGRPLCSKRLGCVSIGAQFSKSVCLRTTTAKARDILSLCVVSWIVTVDYCIVTFCFVLGSRLARSRWLDSSLGMRCIPILDDGVDDDDDDSRLRTSAVSRWFCSLLWRASAFSDLGLRLRCAVVTFLLTFSQSVGRSVS